MKQLFFTHICLINNILIHNIKFIRFYTHVSLSVTLCTGMVSRRKGMLLCQKELRNYNPENINVEKTHSKHDDSTCQSNNSAASPQIYSVDITSFDSLAGPYGIMLSNECCYVTKEWSEFSNKSQPRTVSMRKKMWYQINSVDITSFTSVCPEDWAIHHWFAVVVSMWNDTYIQITILTLVIYFREW